MKSLVCAALALSLAACAAAGPPVVSFPVERADTLARASHAVSCGAVETSHARGLLTGSAFNRAKAYCVDADAILDAAEAALYMGDAATAGERISAAVGMIDAAAALTPKDR